MLDTANPSDLLLIQIMTGLRHRYESLNRQYEERLIKDFRVNAPGISAHESTRPSWLAFSVRKAQLLWNAIRSALVKLR
jgi:hypothetical protein